MTRWLPLLLVLVLAGCGASDETSAPAASAPAADAGPVLEGAVTRLDGTREDLSRYRGKVVLVVNTASECGFTGQFEGLQELWSSRRDDGLVLLGFPANDFAQESRSEAEIADFCKLNYGVTFPMFEKTVVTGDDAAPLFRALGEPDWNFNKYLLDRQGRLVERWGASTEPDDPELLREINRLLA